MCFVKQLPFKIINSVYQNMAYSSFLRIQVTCYKTTLNESEQNKNLYMNHNDNIYNSMENEYNNLSMPLNGAFYDYAKKLIGTKKNSHRRMLKYTARIHNEMRKACKKENIGDNACNQLKKSIKLFRKSFRTSFVNFSYSLPEELYHQLPDQINVTIDDIQYPLKKLYLRDEQDGKYKFDHKYINRKALKKDVQYLIAPYVFNYYNS